MSEAGLPAPEPVEGAGSLSAADRALAEAVTRALTGQRVETTPTGASPQELADALVGAGWNAERLQQLRGERQEQEEPWPFPVERELLATAGFARHQSSLKEVRRLLGVDGLVPTRHLGPKVLGPAERRLLADVPPHHGNVG